jgi:predicted transcriptional regulator
MKHKRPTTDNRSKEIPHGVRLFGSISRARILALLIDQQGQQLYQREIMYEIGFPLQPVQGELKNLVDLGIVKKVRAPNRVYYEIKSTPIPLFINPLKRSANQP